MYLLVSCVSCPAQCFAQLLWPGLMVDGYAKSSVWVVETHRKHSPATVSDTFWAAVDGQPRGLPIRSKARDRLLVATRHQHPPGTFFVGNIPRSEWERQPAAVTRQVILWSLVSAAMIAYNETRKRPGGRHLATSPLRNLWGYPARDYEVRGIIWQLAASCYWCLTPDGASEKQSAHYGSDTMTCPHAPRAPARFHFAACRAATSVTIVSGAIAERVKIAAYVIYAIVLTSFIYPLVRSR